MEDSKGQEGFEAIYGRIHSLYPEQEGMYYRSMLPSFLEGESPLEGVEVWKCEEGCPHWHYVTYGFSELFEKESENLSESGYGFELTFRLERQEEEPPYWPIHLLQSLARYVFASGNVLIEGQHMSRNGPIAPNTNTKLTSLGFMVDPKLGELETLNGHMKFLQAVAMTEDEKNAMMCWSGEAFLREMSKWIPLCVTKLPRSSLILEPAFRIVWENGMVRDGSSTPFLNLEELKGYMKGKKGIFCVGAGHTDLLTRLLLTRLGKGRELWLYSEKDTVLFRAGKEASVRMEDDVLVIALNGQAIKELAENLEPYAGEVELGSIPLRLIRKPS